MVSVLAGLCTAAGWGLAGSAAAAVTVNGGNPPVIGAQVTATADFGDSITGWVQCSAGGSPGAQISAGNPYTLALRDVGTYVCAEEQPLLGPPMYSSPVGPVAPASLPTLASAAGQPVQQGQTLTVTRGNWGPSATIADQWEDCNAAGAACQPIARATGTSYTVTRADVEHVIAVRETATTTNPSASQTATTPPTGPASAEAPDNSVPPAITGTAQVGHTLSASTGTWSNDPTDYAYSWARCARGSCTAIAGATKPTYTATPGDVGDSLEVRVSASVDSVMGPGYPSAPTSPVTGAAGGGGGSGGSGGGGTSTPGGGSRKTHLGHITATMQWSFRYAPAFTQILALAVDGPSFGSTITIGCVGGGCPYTTHRRTITKPRSCSTRRTRRCRSPRTVNLHSSFTRRRLRVGTVLTVTITRRSDVGKYYRFVVRPRRQPTVKISCLAPHSSRPGKGCTSS